MSPLILEAAQQPGVASRTMLCRELGVSRASYYRHAVASEPVDEDMVLRDEIQRIALEWTSYGYRRITQELHRRRFLVNHKRVLRLMRQDNLLCLRKRAFVCTTDSKHGLPCYENLVPTLTLTGIDQLWVADITYLRLGREFVYLAVILDAFSRRVIGWELGRRLDASLTVAALRRALALRKPSPGLVHHSDRGVQYASREYTALLEEADIRISMSRKGNPYDNAQAESFMKTLKCEEVYLREYANLADARSHIAHFLEEVYNQKRLHSALGYRPPAEFEAAYLTGSRSTPSFLEVQWTWTQNGRRGGRSFNPLLPSFDEMNETH